MVMLKQSSPQSLLCPACGRATVYKYLYNRNGCDILRCDECGLGRAEAKAFDPTAYYTSGYFSGKLPDGYADYLGAEQVLRREFARTVDFVRLSCPSGKLLEIGCAYGFFLKEAMRYFEVSGIELSDDAAAHCRQAGLNVLSGEADEANLERVGEMDVIVMLDVVEHLRDPYATLSACAKKFLRNAFSLRKKIKPRRYYCPDDWRLRLKLGTDGGSQVASYDAAATPMVPYRRKHPAMVDASRHEVGEAGLSMEDRASIAHLVSTPALGGV